MNRYGQSITWGTVSAPHIFTGECTGYTARSVAQRQLEDDEAGDIDALILHSQKTEISFDAKVRSGSEDFLDLSAGASITVSGISSGTVLASRAVERWQLGQPKTASVTATHYPDVTGGDGESAGELSAFTPAQTGLGIVTPGSVLIYGTYGLTHASGVVHGLTIEQILELTEDDPSPAGTILGVVAHGYLRTIQLELLATGALPAVGSTLAITGAPDHAGGYKIESAEKKFASKRGMMYSVSAVWVPPMAA